MDLRKGISERLDRLKENPYKNCGAHKLHGRLKDKYACWLGANIRMIYSIKDIENLIIFEVVGGVIRVTNFCLSKIP